MHITQTAHAFPGSPLSLWACQRSPPHVLHPQPQPPAWPTCVCTCCAPAALGSHSARWTGDNDLRYSLPLASMQPGPQLCPPAPTIRSVSPPRRSGVGPVLHPSLVFLFYREPNRMVPHSGSPRAPQPSGTRWDITQHLLCCSPLTSERWFARGPGISSI